MHSSSLPLCAVVYALQLLYAPGNLEQTPLALLSVYRCSPGPAYNAGGNARVIFVPDTPGVRSLVTRVAMAVSCPTEPYKRICSSSSITTFPCMFGVKQAPAECKVHSSGCSHRAVLARSCHDHSPFGSVE